MLLVLFSSTLSWGWNNNNKTHIRPQLLYCIVLFTFLLVFLSNPVSVFIVCWTQQAVLNGDRGWIGPTPHKIEFHQYKVNTITRLSAGYGRVGIPAEWIRSTFLLMAVVVASFFHFRNRSYSAVTFSGHGYSLAVYPVMDLFDLCVPTFIRFRRPYRTISSSFSFLLQIYNSGCLWNYEFLFHSFTHTEIDFHNIYIHPRAFFLFYLPLLWPLLVGSWNFNLNV